MPKPTFFNLSQEKRELLIKAAKKEFSRVPLYDAVIANIVKSAGIPRGSFYQYFEDKEDVFYYLLEESSKENKKHFISNLKKSHGDLFDAFIKDFRRMNENFRKKENRNFFRNAFLNMNHKVEDTFTSPVNKEKFKDHILEISRLADREQLNISEDRELFHVIHILMAVTMHNLIHNFAKELPFEEALKNYTLEIELLKKGLYKENYSSKDS